MRSSGVFGCCHRNHTDWGLPQAWVGVSSQTPATHTGSVATLVSGKQLLWRERQTQGYCDLHSSTCHFQTRFIKSHMAETPQRYQVKGKGGWKKGMEVCWRDRDSFYWQRSLQTILLLVLKNPFPNREIKSWPWLFLPSICFCPHSSWEGRQQGSGTHSLPKGKFSSRSADYGWVLFQRRERR